MQWLLQEFEDTHKLAHALNRLGVSFTWHKVVPFVGELSPEPEIANPHSVVLFGSYTLWRYAEAHGLSPGVFRLRLFVNEEVWHPYLLNGPEALFLTLNDLPEKLQDDGHVWFIRPVEDSKEEPGRIRTTGKIIRLAKGVLALDKDEIPRGSLRHDTLLMLTQPVHIQKEWRTWAVGGEITTYSLYKEGSRIVHRREIDDDVLAFARHMLALNPNYSPAYVMDICRTADGLRILETNCINAAGFYAADLLKLAVAVNDLV